MNTVARLRFSIFVIWFCTILFVIVIFAIRLIVPPGGGIRRFSFDEIQPSLSSIMGIVLPNFAVIMAFYFSFESRKDEFAKNASRELILITIVCSITYHFLLWLALVFGILMLGFESQADASEGILQYNASAVAIIMSYFSIFLAPVAYFFGKRHS